jgi:NAD(P)-dependent dehydrogenase (short-subunit alcohol dehydrogenase family)
MKTIVLTGASSGFGYITAKFLCDKGYRVIATLRDITTRNLSVKKELEEFSEKSVGLIDIAPLDVTSELSIKQFVEYIDNNIGHIDCLINNAGLGAMGFVETFSLDQARKIFDVNLFGPLSLTKAFMPLFRRQKEALVIFVSSACGRLCFPFLSIYNASKFALEGLVESWQIETKPLGIEMCLVEPGAYPSELHNKRLLPENEAVLDEYGTLKDASDQMVSAILQAFSDPSTSPDPREVSDTIAKLIETSHGSRPLRSIVGVVGTDGIEELNQENSVRQSHLLSMFGIALA